MQRTFSTGPCAAKTSYVVWAGAMGSEGVTQILNITLVLYCFFTFQMGGWHLLTRHFPPPNLRRGGIKGGLNLINLNP